MALGGSGMERIFSSRAAGVQPALNGFEHCMRRRSCYPAGMYEKTAPEPCTAIDQPGWLELRLALWPDATPQEHRGYMAISLAQPERFLQLVVYDTQRRAIGFIEGSIRADYVNGTVSSPVGF